MEKRYQATEESSVTWGAAQTLCLTGENFQKDSPSNMLRLRFQTDHIIEMVGFNATVESEAKRGLDLLQAGEPKLARDVKQADATIGAWTSQDVPREPRDSARTPHEACQPRLQPADGVFRWKVAMEVVQDKPRTRLLAARARPISDRPRVKGDHLAMARFSSPIRWEATVFLVVMVQPRTVSDSDVQENPRGESVRCFQEPHQSPQLFVKLTATPEDMRTLRRSGARAQTERRP
ncbi:hypothetical protein LAZ67_11002089 [Cordylochernes scorpioides]|uniref:Uncharacterized protein n=1 Tax=Cordylochernes scorpioides TaxID=51811 RepID=A0ABY6KZG3_9ARAC|nr:hypothetical protein LAZ67_11002089 [Cordylochernes scorpioides]